MIQELDCGRGEGEQEGEWKERVMRLTLGGVGRGVVMSSKKIERRHMAAMKFICRAMARRRWIVRSRFQ